MKKRRYPVRAIGMTDQQWDKVKERAAEYNATPTEFVRAIALHGKVTKEIELRLRGAE